MTVKTKRAYEPASKSDGKRVLVERLWPRGLTKAKVAAEWHKEVAPSAALRTWYQHDPARWPEFQRRYRAELRANPDAWAPLAAVRGTLTLVYAARDAERNSAIVLREFLLERLR
jgi:uncharacterized protein YeaO (DUF488 family)